MPSCPLACCSRGPPEKPTSPKPMFVFAFTSPGVTHLPVASTRSASPGIATSLPTATILPLRINTVPPSIGGPLTGYTLPPVIAIVCALTAVVIAHIATNASALELTDRFTGHLRPVERSRDRSPSATARQRRYDRREARRRSTPSRHACTR